MLLWTYFANLCILALTDVPVDISCNLLWLNDFTFIYELTFLTITYILSHLNVTFSYLQSFHALIFFSKMTNWNASLHEFCTIVEVKRNRCRCTIWGVAYWVCWLKYQWKTYLHWGEPLRKLSVSIYDAANKSVKSVCGIKLNIWWSAAAQMLSQPC